MNCRRCGTENPETSRYCSSCGAPLTSRPSGTRPGLRLAVLAAAGALLLAAALMLLVPSFRPWGRSGAPSPPAAEGQARPGAVLPAPTQGGSTASSLALVSARFVLEGAPRGAPASIETALFDGSWAALPLWTFFGPGLPRLENPDGSGTLVPAGVGWNAPEPVVLCRFDLAEGLDTPGLAAFDHAAPLEWRPLKGERASVTIETGPLLSAGSFLAFDVFKPIESAGILVQGAHIVGWTFGEGVARGYLWAPVGGRPPQATLSVLDLSSRARSGTREGSFAGALALPTGTATADRLEAFAAGFRGRALLQAKDLPTLLKPAAVTALMSSLTTYLVLQGQAAEASRILTADVLAAAADLSLIESAARARNEAQGFDSAHQLLVRLRGDPSVRAVAAANEIDAIEVGLAKSALHKILNDRGIGGLEIFDLARRLAPNDLELRLLGAEAAVLEKDWARAEELLGDVGDYADELADKARTLGRLVEEGRREEDSVTIRFNPGDKLIPVYAYLNKRYRQKFYIDTGATTTIIPTAAAAALEIRIDNSTPVVGIQGVAGGDLAYQVGLESIEVERLVVNDIRAIVYDVGDSENAGLLGNDFLQHFQVDLDSVKGILKLRKK